MIYCVSVAIAPIQENEKNCYTVPLPTISVFPITLADSDETIDYVET